MVVDFHNVGSYTSPEMIALGQPNIACSGLNSTCIFSVAHNLQYTYAVLVIVFVALGHGVDEVVSSMYLKPIYQCLAVLGVQSMFSR